MVAGSPSFTYANVQVVKPLGNFQSVSEGGGELKLHWTLTGDITASITFVWLTPLGRHRLLLLLLFLTNIFLFTAHSLATKKNSGPTTTTSKGRQTELLLLCFWHRRRISSLCMLFSSIWRMVDVAFSSPYWPGMFVWEFEEMCIFHMWVFLLDSCDCSMVNVWWHVSKCEDSVKPQWFQSQPVMCSLLIYPLRPFYKTVNCLLQENLC